MSADHAELLDFFAEGLRIFGPSTRPAIYFESRGQQYRANLAMPADPTWKPPAKKFWHPRNPAHSHNRGTRHGKTKG